ncbi:arginine-tRNA-protein transferase [Pisolithus croceorrhizus]|nr:arginine-tRNA-protein transferase [Pisolithus croceorrhizus]KAI6130546.1 arginine-tRNA-protein transferase [Pisolithus croceorrhizus]
MISIATPVGSGSSSCGYCSPPGERRAGSSFKKAGLVASRLSCGVYQKMIDRGWRRSGTYCYSPDSRRSCCPHYTIKLDALAFKPSRSQRKLVNRLGDDMDIDQSSKTAPPPKQPPAFCLISNIHLSEKAFLPETEMLRHNFEVTLEHSSYTDEKYNLYVTYQTQIHHDPDKTPIDFNYTLLRNTPWAPSKAYGSYHQLYRIDGELAALGVIDILPGCVSSVYFMYDPKWEKHSLGKLSALREASLAKEIHDAGVPSMTALYMGYYIHTCAKMRYKGDYSPSYLADPEDYTLHPLESCIPLLDRYHYATFTQPEHSLESPADIEEEGAVPDTGDSEVPVLFSIIDYSRVPQMTRQWEDAHDREDILSCVRALGNDLAREIVFHM